MKNGFIILGLVAAFLMGVACGGGGSSSGGNNNGGGSGQPSHSPVTMSSSYRPAGGFHILPGSKPTQVAENHGFSFDLVPKAYAQTSTTGTVIGNFEGICPHVTVDFPGAHALFGLGRYDLSCNGLPSPGPKVLQSGVLRNLSASASVGQSATTASGLVQVYVAKPGQAPTPVNLTCTFGQVANGQEAQCEDRTNSVAVEAGDRVAAALITNNGDTYVNLTVSFQLMTQ